MSAVSLKFALDLDDWTVTATLTTTICYGGGDDDDGAGRRGYHHQEPVMVQHIEDLITALLSSRWWLHQYIFMSYCSISYYDVLTEDPAKDHENGFDGQALDYICQGRPWTGFPCHAWGS